MLRLYKVKVVNKRIILYRIWNIIYKKSLIKLKKKNKLILMNKNNYKYHYKMYQKILLVQKKKYHHYQMKITKI